MELILLAFWRSLGNCTIVKTSTAVQSTLWTLNILWIVDTGTDTICVIRRDYWKLQNCENTNSSTSNTEHWTFFEYFNSGTKTVSNYWKGIVNCIALHCAVCNVHCLCCLTVEWKKYWCLHLRGIPCSSWACLLCELHTFWTPHPMLCSGLLLLYCSGFMTTHWLHCVQCTYIQLARSHFAIKYLCRSRVLQLNSSGLCTQRRTEH